MKRFATIILLGLFAVGCQIPHPARMVYRGAPFRFPVDQMNNVTVDRVADNVGRINFFVQQYTKHAADFETALKKTLGYMQLLSANGAYLLKASFENIDWEQPSIPFVIIDRVTIKIRYTLINRSNGEMLMNELVTTTSEASVSDSFNSEKRKAMAFEGCARDSIGQILMKLSQLSGTSPPGYVPTEPATEEGEMMF
ncbi:MAG: hypothetical protein VYC39_20140, partial [Myxococcota bacterium]|nr:hypothetical protein [Myxococcota bacterium]